MKIAFTSTGDTLDAIIDSRFGRCSYFAIYNSEKNKTEFLLNPGKDAREGAGPVSVQFLAEHAVNKIVSVEFGTKIKPLLESLNINMITHLNAASSIAELIGLYNQ